MFKRPLSLKGRIGRTEYVLSFVVYAAISAFAIMSILAGGSMLLLLAFPVLLWFALAQNTKRCHDRGNSGWYQLIPFYGLWMLFAAGDPGTNQYGPSPKGSNELEVQPAVQ
ncbi:DUF805 domain-containing protein [Mucilaginibacter daejeonensis]|uniref:DUF805 domain-containing protein n=1 Tax=Mucilaginibacter daejeonensis TaxID=398049 RepID=UPI001D172BF1|nr:DUF805 domain-containing protein [Mucilaginibacter daejeonensis]UEG53144.1 DUF805 domain-containing protein [Mucilaginibacter daejeonensis]